MFFIIGFVVVVGTVFGGYTAMGGKLGILWEPFEFVIIFGAGIGAFIIGSSKPVIGGVAKCFGTLMKGPTYNKPAYLELLCVLYSVFKLAKTKGDLALEAHVENPDQSTIFTKFPKFAGDHHAVEFLCDYLRMLTLGTSNAHEVENIIEQELEIHHHEKMSVADAVQNMADGFPALGIVAAILGIIKTMASITEPPEVLGGLIAAALVGSFSGIFISYGFVAPMASSLKATYNSDHHYMGAIKVALIAHMQGYAPQVSVEFARKSLESTVRPSFKEVEEMISNIPGD